MYWRGFWLTALVDVIACGVWLLLGTRYFPKLNENSSLSQSNFQLFFAGSLAFIIIYLIILRLYLFGLPWNE